MAYSHGFSIADKVCVVTGGGSGIGRGYCIKFAEKAAKAVIVADINATDANETVALLKGINGGNTKAEFIFCDVSTEDGIKNLIDKVIKDYGGIDLFAANAGIVSMLPQGLENFDQAVFDRVMKINTLHPIWAAKHLVPYWLERSSAAMSNPSSSSANACFVTTASAAGLLTEVHRLPYTVSKYGAVSFSEFMGINYGPKGINTVCVCPQAVESKMTTSDLGAGAAGVDGIASAADLSELVSEAIESGKFFVCLPDKIKVYMGRKAQNYDRWLSGMQKFKARY